MSSDRPLNNFISCTCGIKYVSGYTHCPNCGKVNPNDKNTKKEV